MANYYKNLFSTCFVIYLTLIFLCECGGKILEKTYEVDTDFANTLCPEPEIEFHTIARSKIMCIGACTVAGDGDGDGVIFRQPDKECYCIKKGSACIVGTTSLPGAKFYRYFRPPPECVVSSRMVPNVPSNKMTSSSNYNGYYATYGRLDGSYHWAAGDETLDEYIQVNFGTERIVTAIVTQGAAADNEWFTSYNLETSLDCVTWDISGPHPGNSDKTSHVTLTLATAVLARCVRINPLSWYSWPSGRIEVYGCLP